MTRNSHFVSRLAQQICQRPRTSNDDGFSSLLKGAILDAVDEGLVPRDPTRKAIVKGKAPGPKKSSYLNQFELQKLLADLDLGQEIGWEWFVLLVAKTGLRFSEALAITPSDFDFNRQTLSVSKTWDYKSGHALTHESSVVNSQ